MTTSSSLEDQQASDAIRVRPLEFHRLARGYDTYRWWRPLAVGGLACIFYAVLSLVCLTAIIVAGLLAPELEQVTDAFLNDAAIDMNDPFTFLAAVLSIILLLPSLLLAMRILGARPVGLLSSVAGRIRWPWLFRCLGLAVAAFGISMLVSAVVAAVQGAGPPQAIDVHRVLVMTVLTLLFVPLQAAAEEYVFRGYLMQAVGGWFRHPAVAIVLPVPFFVLAHDYGLLGLIDIAAFALVAGWLSWRTGGLEAAIALHVANNLSIFLLAPWGLADANATGLGPVDLILSLVVFVVFAAAVLRMPGRQRIGRTAIAA